MADTFRLPFDNAVDDAAMRQGLVLMALACSLSGCARMVEAAINPGAAAINTASDLGTDQAIGDIDRILADNPSGESAGDLQALRQDLTNQAGYGRQERNRRENVTLDHHAEHDRRAPRVRPLADKLRLEGKNYRIIERGSQDRRPDPLPAVMATQPRRL